MISRTTLGFRNALAQLPPQVRRQARRAYRCFARDPYHPSLHFKPVHATEPIFSVRISGHYRAVGLRTGEEIVWFWIGSHADYDRLLHQRRRRPARN